MGGVRVEWGGAGRMGGARAPSLPEEEEQEEVQQEKEVLPYK